MFDQLGNEDSACSSLIKQDARLTLCVSFPMFHSKDRHDRVLLTSPIVLLSVAYRTNLQITKHTGNGST